MATQTQRRIEVAKTISGNNPFTLWFPEAASQTFKAGAVVKLNSSGQVIAGTFDGSNDDVQILGVAAADASNLTTALFSNQIPVYIADDDTVFIGSLYTSQTTAWTDIGSAVGIRTVAVGSQTIYCIDKTKVGGSPDKRRVIVIDLDTRSGLPAIGGVGDVQAQVHFQFLDAFTKMSYTS
jgi:hypothetical protein